MMTTMWDWVDNRAVIRRAVLFVVLWMTWRVTVWAFAFAHAAVYADGMQAAAVIVAVTGPFAALQAFVFKWYSDSRAE